ncbi:MAG: tyrosine-type recombinase/integrase [Bacteriovoracaceae bacterium]|nr:tyrosine-type recombinase/integrase [Bacteriovoracaceae bacterium]
MSRSENYKKIRNTTGIYQNKKNGQYMVEKRVRGLLHTKTFSTLYEAKQWQKFFDGEKIVYPEEVLDEKSNYSTLKEVWEVMQKKHFPSLATSTRSVWTRRYELLKGLEHLPMDRISPSRITEWVIERVSYYSSEEYQGSGRGRAGRCNLNTELNMFVTIFNWYKQSEDFEKEAVALTCPVKTKHRKMGFIKPLPDKIKQINLQDAFLFFDFLRPLYQDLAKMQFFCAGRIGEIAGLQWTNIDLRNRRMLIKDTCVWDTTNKMFIELKPFPKNREARAVYITDEILEILNRREAFRLSGNNFVFHVEGAPLNYCTIQINYREAQRKSGIPYTGTHILRHGMAKLARKVGGGLDAVLAMTGHKDLKLADHYSKSNEDDQKDFSEMIMKHIRKELTPKTEEENLNNVFRLKLIKSS